MHINFLIIIRLCTNLLYATNCYLKISKLVSLSLKITMVKGPGPQKPPTRAQVREGRGGWAGLAIQTYKRDGSLNIMFKPMILGLLNSIQEIPPLFYRSHSKSIGSRGKGVDSESFWLKVQDMITFDSDPQSPPYSLRAPLINKELAADRIGAGSKYHLALQGKLQPEYVSLGQRVQKEDTEEIAEAMCYGIEPALASSFKCIRIIASVCLSGFMVGLSSTNALSSYILTTYMQDQFLKTMLYDICDIVRYTACTTVTNLLSPSNALPNNLTVLLSITKNTITDPSPSIRISGFALILKVLSLSSNLMNLVSQADKTRLVALVAQNWQQHNQLYCSLFKDECPESAALAILTVHTCIRLLPTFNQSLGADEAHELVRHIMSITFSTERVLRRVAGLAYLSLLSPGDGNSSSPYPQVFFDEVYGNILKESPTRISLTCIAESLVDTFASFPQSTLPRHFFSSLLPHLLDTISNDTFLHILIFVSACLMQCYYKKIVLFDHLVLRPIESVFYDEALDTLKSLSELFMLERDKAIFQYTYRVLLDEETTFLAEADYEAIAECILHPILIFSPDTISTRPSQQSVDFSLISLYRRFTSALSSFKTDNLTVKLEELCTAFLYLLYLLVDHNNVLPTDGNPNLVSETFRKELESIYEGLFITILPGLSPALYNNISNNALIYQSNPSDKGDSAIRHVKLVPKLIAHYLQLGGSTAQSLVSTHIREQLMSIYSTLSRHELPPLQYGFLADIVSCITPADLTIYDNIISLLKLDPLRLQSTTYYELAALLRIFLVSLIWLKGSSRVSEGILDNFLFNLLTPVAFSTLRSCIYFMAEIKKGIRILAIQRHLLQHPGLLSLISTVIQVCFVLYTSFSEYYNNQNTDRSKMENLSDLILHMYFCAHFLGKEFLSARDDCMSDLKLLTAAKKTDTANAIEQNPNITKSTYYLLVKADKSTKSLIELAFQATFTIFRDSLCYYVYLYANLFSMTLGNRFLLNNKFTNLSCPSLFSGQAGAIKVIPAYANQFAGFLEISRLSTMLLQDEFELYKSLLPNYGTIEEVTTKYCSLLYGAYTTLKKYARTRQQATKDYIVLCSILRMLEATESLVYPRALLEEALSAEEAKILELNISQLLKESKDLVHEDPQVAYPSHQVITDVPILGKAYSSSQPLLSGLFQSTDSSTNAVSNVVQISKTGSQELVPLGDEAEPQNSPSGSPVDSPNSANEMSPKDPLTIDFLLSQMTLAANSNLIDSSNENSADKGLSDLRDILE